MADDEDLRLASTLHDIISQARDFVDRWEKMLELPGDEYPVSKSMAEAVSVIISNQASLITKLYEHNKVLEDRQEEIIKQLKLKLH